MRYCKSCRMKIENDIERCPLCGSLTEPTEGASNNDCPNVTDHTAIRYATRAVLLFAIIASVVTVYINIFYAKEVPWSIICVLGSAYLTYSTNFILKTGKNYAFFVLFQVLLVSVIVYVIDLMFKNLGWSINYVIPFLIISGCIALSLLGMIKPVKYKEYLVYLLVLAILGLLPLIAVLCRWTKVAWTSLVCVFYSAATILGMILFTGKRVRAELKKKLHF